jgi:hypothetical protein
MSQIEESTDALLFSPSITVYHRFHSFCFFTEMMLHHGKENSTGDEQ